MHRFAVGCLASACIGTAAASPPDLGQLLKRPQYESLTISPRGDFLAALVPLEDRTVAAIVRRSDMRISAQYDPGKDGFADSVTWVGDSRVFISWSMRFGAVTQPYSMGYLYSMDADGRNRRGFAGRVVDTLPYDATDDEILILDCVKVVKNNCQTRLKRVRTDGKGAGVTVADGPIADARFMADRQGLPRFSWAVDDKDIQRAYLWLDGRWSLFNDETASGIEAYPAGISHDLKSGYLWSERKDRVDVIERVDLATGERRTVASDPDFSPAALAWSFDGSEPIGAYFGKDVPKLRFFDEAHPHAELTRQLELAFPGEWARVTSTTKDGRTAIVTVTSDVEPGRYYLLDTASGDLKLLARSRPWLEAKHLAESRLFTLQARDGVVLYGYLTLPKNAQGPAPLVVMPHGGPFGIEDAWTYDDEVQILASRGFAVLRVNFRGSGGRGRSFIESGYREWGAKMQDDVTDATRWAMKQDGIDGARICMWGASYGGYAALMGAVREPELYRCVIGMAGPYHLPSMHDWGEIQRSKWGEGQLAETLGSDRLRLLAQSPTSHAAEIKAKVMLVQGGRDARVPPTHVRLMKKAFDDAGIRYEGYFPMDETHGFYRESSRREYYEKVLDFLDRNLVGAAGG